MGSMVIQFSSWGVAFRVSGVGAIYRFADEIRVAAAEDK